MKWHQLRMPLTRRYKTEYGYWTEDVLDATYLGCGSYRQCWALDDRTVVKIAQNDAGYDCNKHEVEVWQRASANLRKHLADMLGWADDYAWVIMRRAKDTDNYEAPLRVPRVLAESIADTAVHASNVGRIGRTVVAVDYGEYAGYHERGRYAQEFGF